MNTSMGEFWSFVTQGIEKSLEPEMFVVALRNSVEKNIKHLPTEDALAVFLVLVLIDTAVELAKKEHEGG